MSTTDAPVIGYAEWEQWTEDGVKVCGEWLANDELCGRTGGDLLDCESCPQHCSCQTPHAEQLEALRELFPRR